MLVLLAMASAQTVRDRKAEILEVTHGAVHDLISDMLTRDDATLDEWAGNPGKIGKKAQSMCTGGEQGTLKILPAAIKEFRADESRPGGAGEVIWLAARLQEYQPTSKDDLRRMLLAIKASDRRDQLEKQPSAEKMAPTPPDQLYYNGIPAPRGIEDGPVDSALNHLNDPAPDQVEVSREDLICHFIPSPGTPEPTTAAGVVYEVIVGKDGKTKKTKLVTGAGLEYAVRQMRYRPFYVMGEAVEVKSMVTLKMWR